MRLGVLKLAAAALLLATLMGNALAQDEEVEFFGGNTPEGLIYSGEWFVYPVSITGTFGPRAIIDDSGTTTTIFYRDFDDECVAPCVLVPQEVIETFEITQEVIVDADSTTTISYNINDMTIALEDRDTCVDPCQVRMELDDMGNLIDFVYTRDIIPSSVTVTIRLETPGTIDPPGSLELGELDGGAVGAIFADSPGEYMVSLRHLNASDQNIQIGDSISVTTTIRTASAQNTAFDDHLEVRLTIAANPGVIFFPGDQRPDTASETLPSSGLGSYQGIWANAGENTPDVLFSSPGVWVEIPFAIYTPPSGDVVVSVDVAGGVGYSFDPPSRELTVSEGETGTFAVSVRFDLIQSASTEVTLDTRSSDSTFNGGQLAVSLQVDNPGLTYLDANTHIIYAGEWLYLPVSITGTPAQGVTVSLLSSITTNLEYEDLMINSGEGGLLTLSLRYDEHLDLSSQFTTVLTLSTYSDDMDFDNRVTMHEIIYASNEYFDWGVREGGVRGVWFRPDNNSARRLESGILESIPPELVGTTETIQGEAGTYVEYAGGRASVFLVGEPGTQVATEVTLQATEITLELGTTNEATRNYPYTLTISVGFPSEPDKRALFGSPATNTSVIVTLDPDPISTNTGILVVTIGNVPTGPPQQATITLGLETDHLPTRLYSEAYGGDPAGFILHRVFNVYAEQLVMTMSEPELMVAGREATVTVGIDSIQGGAVVNIDMSSTDDGVEFNPATFALDSSTRSAEVRIRYDRIIGRRVVPNVVATADSDVGDFDGLVVQTELEVAPNRSRILSATILDETLRTRNTGNVDPSMPRTQATVFVTEGTNVDISLHVNTFAPIVLYDDPVATLTTFLDDGTADLTLYAPPVATSTVTSVLSQADVTAHLDVFGGDGRLSLDRNLVTFSSAEDMLDEDMVVNAMISNPVSTGNATATISIYLTSDDGAYTTGMVTLEYEVVVRPDDPAVTISEFPRVYPYTHAVATVTLERTPAQPVIVRFHSDSAGQYEPTADPVQLSHPGNRSSDVSVQVTPEGNTFDHVLRWETESTDSNFDGLIVLGTVTPVPQDDAAWYVEAEGSRVNSLPLQRTRKITITVFGDESATVSVSLAPSEAVLVDPVTISLDTFQVPDNAGTTYYSGFSIHDNAAGNLEFDSNNEDMVLEVTLTVDKSVRDQAEVNDNEEDPDNRHLTTNNVELRLRAHTEETAFTNRYNDGLTVEVHIREPKFLFDDLPDLPGGEWVTFDLALGTVLIDPVTLSFGADVANVAFDTNPIEVMVDTTVAAVSVRYTGPVRNTIPANILVTATSPDGYFNDISVSIPINFLENDIFEAPEPEPVVAGRWAEMTAFIRFSPGSENVTLEFTSQPDLQFFYPQGITTTATVDGSEVTTTTYVTVSPVTMTLHAFALATVVSVRYDGVVPASLGDLAVPITVSLTSPQADFDGISATVDATFTTNDDAKMELWEVDAEPANSVDVSSANPTLIVDVTEPTELFLGVQMQLEPEETVTVSVVVTDDGGGRIVTTAMTVDGAGMPVEVSVNFGVLEFNGTTGQFVTLTIDYTGEASSVATVEFRQSTDDGAFAEYGEVHGNVLTARIDIARLENPIILSIPTVTMEPPPGMTQPQTLSVIAGRNVPITVELLIPPDDTVTVNLQANPGANVTFDEASPELNTAGTTVVLARYTQNNIASGSQVTVDFSSTSGSDDTRFDGKTSTTDPVLFNSNLRSKITVTHDGVSLTPDQSDTSTITMSVIEGYDAVLQVAMEERPIQPMTVTIGPLPGSDSRIVSDADSSYVIAGEGIPLSFPLTIKTRALPGTADRVIQLKVTMTTTDGAYELYASEHGSYVPVEITVQPAPALTIVRPPVDTVAGRGLPLTISLTATPSAPVTVTLISGNPTITFNAPGVTIVTPSSTPGGPPTTEVFEDSLVLEDTDPVIISVHFDRFSGRMGAIPVTATVLGTDDTRFEDLGDSVGAQFLRSFEARWYVNGIHPRSNNVMPREIRELSAAVTEGAETEFFIGLSTSVDPIAPVSISLVVTDASDGRLEFVNVPNSANPPFIELTEDTRTITVTLAADYSDAGSAQGTVEFRMYSEDGAYIYLGERHGSTIRALVGITNAERPSELGMSRPASAPAGRWSTFAVSLATLPSATPATVSLTTAVSNVEFNPATVHLSDMNEFPVSVRYNQIVSSESPIPITAILGSSDPDFHGEIASRNFVVQGETATWSIAHGDSSLTPSNNVVSTLRITLVEGSNEGVFDISLGDLAPDTMHPVTISAVILTGSDSRVTSGSGDTFTFTSANFGDTQQLMLDIAGGGTTDGSATIEFTLHTRDGAYELSGNVNGNTLQAVVEVWVNPLSLEDMDPVLSGVWSTLTLSLNNAPPGSALVTVNLGSDNTDIEFNPAAGTVVFDSTTPAEISVRHNAYNASGAAGQVIAITAGTESAAELFDGLTGQIDVTFQDNSDYTFNVYVGGSPTPVFPHDPTTDQEVLLTVFLDNNNSYEVNLAQRPSVNITVAVALRAGSDNRVSIGDGLSQLVFTPANYATRQTVRIDASAGAMDTDQAVVEFSIGTTQDNLFNLRAAVRGTEVLGRVSLEDSPIAIIQQGSLIPGHEMVVTVSLSLVPTAVVDIDVSSDFPDLTIDPDELQLSAGTRHLPVTLTYNQYAASSRNIALNVSATSSDTNFNNLDVSKSFHMASTELFRWAVGLPGEASLFPDVLGTIPTINVTLIEGSAVTFNVQPQEDARPLEPITISAQVLPGGDSRVAVEQGAELIFDEWSVMQVAVTTAVNDALPSGIATVQLTMTTVNPSAYQLYADERGAVIHAKIDVLSNPLDVQDPTTTSAVSGRWISVTLALTENPVAPVTVTFTALPIEHAELDPMDPNLSEDVEFRPGATVHLSDTTETVVSVRLAALSTLDLMATINAEVLSDEVAFNTAEDAVTLSFLRNDRFTYRVYSGATDTFVSPQDRMNPTVDLTVFASNDATYRVVLAEPPVSNVTIDVNLQSGGYNRLSLVDGPLELEFTPSNYNVTQTVTMRASGGDSGTGFATVRFFSSSQDLAYQQHIVANGGGTRGRVEWTPSPLYIRLNSSDTTSNPLALTPGSEVGLMVGLTHAPSDAMTVDITRSNTDVSVSATQFTLSAATLEFEVTVLYNQYRDSGALSRRVTASLSGPDTVFDGIIAAKDINIQPVSDMARWFVRLGSNPGIAPRAGDPPTISIGLLPGQAATLRVQPDDGFGLSIAMTISLSAAVSGNDARVSIVNDADNWVFTDEADPPEAVTITVNDVASLASSSEALFEFVMTTHDPSPHQLYGERHGFTIRASVDVLTNPLVLELDPSGYAAGHWIPMTITLSRAPTQPVTVAFTSDAGANIDFNVGNDRVTLSSTTTGAVLSVRYVNSITGTEDVEVMASATSDESGFGGATQRKSTSIASEDTYYWEISSGTETARPMATRQAIAVNLVETREVEITVRLNEQPKSDVRIDLSLDDNADNRVSFKGGVSSFEFTSANYAQQVLTLVGGTGSPGSGAGSAEIRFNMVTDDGAYELYASDTSSDLYGDVSVFDNPLVLTGPGTGSAIASGRWAPLTLRLAIAPTEAVVVALDTSWLLARLSQDEVTLTDTSEVVVSVRTTEYDIDEPDDRTVRITASVSASGADYDGLKAETRVSFDLDSVGYWFLSNTGRTSQHANPLEDPNRSLTLEVKEGSTTAYEMFLALEPTANVTFDVALQSGGDDRVAIAGGVSQLEFTSANYAQRQTVMVTTSYSGATNGNAFIQFTMTSDDDAFRHIANFETDTLTGQVDVLQSSLTLANPADDTPTGHWHPVTVALRHTPSDPVDVSFTYLDEGAATNLEFEPDPPQVRLSDTSDAVISVRYNDATGNYVDTNISPIAMTATADSDDDDFDDHIATFDVGFGPNSNFTWGVQRPGDSANRVVPLDRNVIGVVNAAVFEGNEGRLAVVLDQRPQEDVRITFAEVSDDDNRLTFKNGVTQLTFTPDNYDTAQFLVVETSSTDADDESMATVSFTLGTADLAYSAYAAEHGNVVHGVFRILSSPVSYTQPAGVVAGRWTTSQIALGAVPAHPVTVSLSSDNDDVRFAIGNTTVDYNSAQATVVLSDTTPFAVSLRITGYLAADAAVELRGHARSADPDYHDLEATLNIGIESNDGARWIVDSGNTDPGALETTTFPRAPENTARLTIIEGAEPEFHVRLGSVAPTANVTVNVENHSADTSGRLTDWGPAQLTFTPADFDQNKPITISTSANGSAASSFGFRLSITTSDDAYIEHTNAPRSRDQLFFEVNIIPNPLSLTQPAEVVAGRWTTAQVSLTGPPSDSVTLMLSSDDSNVVFNPANALVTFTATDYSADVSLRYDGGSVPDTMVEFIVVADSDASLYDGLRVTRDVEFEANDEFGWRMRSLGGLGAGDEKYPGEIDPVGGIVTLVVLEGERSIGFVIRERGGTITSDLNFSVTEIAGADSRVELLTDMTVMSPVFYANSEPVTISITLSYSDAPSGSASYEVAMSSDDLAIQEFSDSNGYTLTALVSVRQSPISMSVPTPTIAGHWTEAELRLRRIPEGGHSATLNFFASNADVVFNPSSADALVLDDLMPVTVSMRLNAYAAMDTEVGITVSVSSGDLNLHQAVARQDVTFHDSSSAFWFLEFGSSGTNVAQIGGLAPNIVTLELREGQDADVAVGIFATPTANITISSAYATNSDSRVSVDPLSLWFTPAETDTIKTFRVRTSPNPTDTPDGTASIVFTMTTDDDAYKLNADSLTNGYVLTVSVAVRQNPFVLHPVSPVRAGRWAEAVVSLRSPPSDPVTVSLRALDSSGDVNATVLYESPGTGSGPRYTEVTLSAATLFMTVSLRYDGGAVDDTSVDLEASTSSGVALFNTITVSEVVEFQSNQGLTWWLSNGLTDNELGGRDREYPGATPDPSQGVDGNGRVTVVMLERETTFNLAVFPFSGTQTPLRPTANLEFSANLLDGGDDRVSLVTAMTVMTPENYYQDDVSNITLSLDYSDAPDNAATIEVVMSTEDLAFREHADEHGYTLTGVVSVRRSPIEMSQIPATIAGHWTTVTLQLRSAPSEAVMLTLGASNSDVEFDLPSSDNVVERSDTAQVTVALRLTTYAASNESVDIFVNAESDDLEFDKGFARSTVQFLSSSFASWSLENPAWESGHGGTGIAEVGGAAPNEVGMRLLEGTNGIVEVNLGNIRPTVDVTIRQVLRSGHDVRVTSVAPAEVVFEPDEYTETMTVTVFTEQSDDGDPAGTAQVEFAIVTVGADDAYRLNAEGATGRDKLTVNIEVLPNPLGLSAQSGTEAAGRWAEVQVSLRQDPVPVGERVTVTFSTEADDIEFGQSPATLVFTDMTPAVMSVRLTANVDAGDVVVGIDAVSTSDDADLDGFEASGELTFGPNIAMTLIATTPTGVQDEGTMVQIPVALGSALDAGTQVVVQASIPLDRGGDRASFVGDVDSLTFSAAAAQNLVVEISETATRDNDFEVAVVLTVAEHPDTTDGAFTLRESSTIVVFTVTDTTQGEVSVTPSGMQSVEEGDSVTFDVALSVMPTVNVVVDVSADANIGTLNPTQLTFTRDNWSAAQKVVLSTQDDDRVTADRSGQVTFNPDTTDSNFPDTNVVVDIVVTEDDTVGVSVSPDRVLVGAGDDDGEDVSFALTSEPSAAVRVEVALGIDPMTPVPAGLNVTLDPASPAMLDFDSTNWDAPQVVEVFATFPGAEVDLANDIRFTLTVTPSSTGDSAYDALAAFEVPGEVSRSPLRFGQPGSVVAGRWTMAGISLREDPTGGNVVVTFESDDGDVEFDPASAVLSDTAETEVMIRYAGVLDADDDIEVRAVVSSSPDPDIPVNETVARTVRFLENDTANFTLATGADATAVSRTSGTDMTVLTVTVAEGNDIDFGLTFGLDPVEDVVVEAAIVQPGSADGRVGTPDPVRTVLTTTDDIATPKQVSVPVSHSDMVDGRATVRFTLSSADGAYSHYASDPGHGAVVEAEIEVVQSNLEATQPDTVVAGRWTDLDVSLRDTYANPVTVSFASDDNGVAFSLTPAEIVLRNAGDVAKMQIRYTAKFDDGDNDPVDVSITVSASSDDATYNGHLTYVATRFESNDQARWTIDSGNTEPGAVETFTYPNWNENTARATITEGEQAEFYVELGTIAPTSDVTVFVNGGTLADRVTAFTPDMLVFTPATYSQRLTVTVSTTSTGASEDSQTFRMTIDTSDDAYKQYTANATYQRLSFELSIQPNPLSLTQPASAVAGRWTETEVSLVMTPTGPVMVALTSGDSNVRYLPESGRVTLDGSNKHATVSIRYDGGHVTSDTEVAVTARTTSSEEMFNGLSASRSVEFEDNNHATFRMFDDINQDDDEFPGMSPGIPDGDATVTVVVNEGRGGRSYFVAGHADLDFVPDSDITIAASLLAGGDPRVSLAPEDASRTFAPAEFSGNIEKRLKVSVHYTNEADGLATVLVSLDTTDQAFLEYADDHGATLVALVSVRRSQIEMTQPEPVIAGHLTTITLSLREQPPALAADNVTLTIETDETNVAFLPVDGVDDNKATVTLDHSNYSAGVEVTFSYTAYLDDDTEVEFEVASQSRSNSKFDGQFARRSILFESSENAKWGVDNGLVTLSPLNMTDVVIDINAIQGRDRRINLELSARPTENVVIDVNLASGGDSRITDASFSSRQFTFTPDNWDKAQEMVISPDSRTDAMEGSATVSFTMTTTDEAFLLYSGEHGNSIDGEINILNDPVAVNQPAEVAAGRWSVITVSLRVPPSGDMVTIDFETTAPNTEFARTPAGLTLSDAVGEGLISIRYTENLDSGDMETAEVVAEADSSDDIFVSTIRVDARFGPNHEMVLVHGQPTTPHPEGPTNIEVTLSLDEEVAADSNVIVQARVSDNSDGGNRASFLGGVDRLTYNSDAAQVLTVQVSETASRDNDFTVFVDMSVLPSSTDGAYALRQDTSRAEVVVMDSTQGMLSLTPRPLPQISEGDGLTINLALSVMPTIQVTVDISGVDSAVADLTTPTQLFFDDTNWSVAQQIILETEENDIDDEDRSTNLILTPSTSDTNFVAAFAMPQTLPIVVRDDDIAGFTVAPLSLRIEGKLEAEAEPADITFVLDSQPTASLPVPSPAKVTLDVTLNVDMSLVPMGLTITLDMADPIELEFDSEPGTANRWNIEQTVQIYATFTGEEEVDIDEDIPFTIVVTPSSDDPKYHYDDSLPPGTMQLQPVTVSGHVRRSNQGASEHVGKVMAAVGVGSMQFALDAVGDQSLVDIPEASFKLSSVGSSSENGDPWVANESGWRSDFKSLIEKGASFTLPLEQNESGGGLLMWGRVGYYDFSGTSEYEDQPAEYDGKAFGALYGIGHKFRSGAMVGLAVSHTDSNTDLTDAADLVTVEQKMTALHPYLGLELGDSTRTWVVGSVGKGDVVVGLDNGESVETEAKMQAVGLGIETEWDLGGVNLVTRLEGMGGRTELEESEEFTDENIVDEEGNPVTSDLLRVRFEIEMGPEYVTVAGNVIRPYLSASGRYDGGDLDEEMAYEMGAGIRTTFDKAFAVDLKLRVQVKETDHEEHSLSGRFSYDRGNDGRGLVASVSQEIDEDSTWSGSGKVGYGWGARLLGQRGIFGPTVRYSANDAVTSEFGFVSNRLRLSVEHDGEDEVEAKAEIRVF